MRLRVHSAASVTGASRRRDRARRRHRRQEGAAAVEFALILPLFSLLLLGLIDFGHFFFTMNTIQNAAREAARRASVVEDTSTIDTIAKDQANTYLKAAGLAEGSPGVTKNCTTICPHVDVLQTSPGTKDHAIQVTITVQGAFKNVTGFSYKILPGFDSPFASMKDLKSVSTMRWELAPSQ